MEKSMQGPGCLLKIRSIYPSLAKVNKRIADVILENPRAVITLPVTELADQAGASEGSIVLFCKKLGYQGYHDLKFVLAEEVYNSSPDIHEEIASTDGVPVIIKKVFNTTIQALNDTLALLDPSALEAAAKTILEAQRITIVGVGISGLIAEDFWMKLFRINRNASFYNNQSTMKMAAALTRKEDVVIAISHSGSTIAVIDTLEMARARGARTIALTNYLNSPVSKLADILLLTSSRETGVREEEMTARIAQLAIVDSLFVAVANGSFEVSSAYLRDTRRVADDKV